MSGWTSKSPNVSSMGGRRLRGVSLDWVILSFDRHEHPRESGSSVQESCYGPIGGVEVWDGHRADRAPHGPGQSTGHRARSLSRLPDGARPG